MNYPTTVCGTCPHWDAINDNNYEEIILGTCAKCPHISENTTKKENKNDANQ